MAHRRWEYRLPTDAMPLMKRPKVIAFDVVETLAPLAPVAAALKDAGFPDHTLPLFFAQMLRDAFALEGAGTYRPFATVARATLQVVAATLGVAADAATLDRVMDSFGTLSAASDVKPAFERARAANVRIVTLTNGSAANTQGMLDRSGLATLVDRTISIDEIEHWKPNPLVYRHAAQVCGVAPEEMALVAAHAWDTHGARQVGFQTAWIERKDAAQSTAMAPADVHGVSLLDAVESLVTLPA